MLSTQKRVPYTPKGRSRTITCQNCGAPYETVRANTKFCNVCRLRDDLIFLGTRTTECWDCDKPFAPLNSNDILCAKCGPTRRRNVAGACKICKAPDIMVLTDNVPVCLTCARDPKLRRQVVQLLGKIIARNKMEFLGVG